MPAVKQIARTFKIKDEQFSDIATHLTYQQALEILGPYLDRYLTGPGGLDSSAGGLSPVLSSESGKVENSAGEIVAGNATIVHQGRVVGNCFSLAKVAALADAIFLSGNPDPHSITPPSWPKETRHWQKPESKVSVNAAYKSYLQELIDQGMTLEQLQAHGAPSVGDMQAFLDGTPCPPEYERRISRAADEIARTVGTK